MKLVVTGGAGFIGSNFVKWMIDNSIGSEIHVIDKLTYAGMIENLHDFIVKGQIQFHQQDICNGEAVAPLLQGSDVVFHFAAESHVDNSITGPETFLRTNVMGTFQLLECVKAMTSPPKFCHVSTDEVYGELTDLKSKFTLESSIQPSSPYSSSKAASDLLALSYCRTYQIPVMVTRSSNNFGPNQFPEKFIPRMLSQARKDFKLPVYGDGSNRRDWIFVEDNVEGVFLAGTKGEPGKVYHFGSEKDFSNLEMAKELLKLLNKSEELIEFVEDRKGHDFRYCLDCTETKKELGWSAKTDLSEGLSITTDWYKNNEQWLDAAWKRLEGRG